MGRTHLDLPVTSILSFFAYVVRILVHRWNFETMMIMSLLINFDLLYFLYLITNFFQFLFSFLSANKLVNSSVHPNAFRNLTRLTVL